VTSDRMERYDYELPRDAIARYPPDRRDESRLLVLDRARGMWEDRRFPDILDILAPGDLLVVNETEVFPARLFARRPTGGKVELLLVRPLDGPDPARAEGRRWEALVRPGRKVRRGDALELLDREGRRAGARSIVEGVDEAGRRILRLDVPGDPWRWIGEHGHVPLPPYIGRADEPSDRERYQTVYARHRGAVAAPTAGLHFTPDLLDRLAAKGVGRAAITLHVGPGTFRPVTAERAGDHEMEAEWYDVPSQAAAAIARTREEDGRVVAVGTTVVRALESAALAWGSGPEPARGWTDLYVVPGHRFRAVDALVTNFHLPRSTLLLLVAAFAGREGVLAAYDHAVRAGYRFYSYGDAMLVL